MVDIPENLAPQDGLTNAKIEFASFFVEGTGAIINFEMTDDEGNSVGEFPVEVHPSRISGAPQTVDALIASAHREMIDVLRQWIHELDVSAKAYESRSAPPAQE